MEIKIEKKAKVEAGCAGAPSAGGVRITGDADLEADALVGTVVVELFSVDAVVKVEAKPEDLEKLGVLLRTLRGRIGDSRDLCPEHGYYESKRPHYDCPVCGKNASVDPPEPAKVTPIAAASFRDAERVMARSEEL